MQCDGWIYTVWNTSNYFLSFILDKPVGYKVLCERETIHYKKINKSVLNTTSFYLGDDNHEEVDFNQDTLTFTLQTIKI